MLQRQAKFEDRLPLFNSRLQAHQHHGRKEPIRIARHCGPLIPSYGWLDLTTNGPWYLGSRVNDERVFAPCMRKILDIPGAMYVLPVALVSRSWSGSFFGSRGSLWLLRKIVGLGQALAPRQRRRHGSVTRLHHLWSLFSFNVVARCR